jgi:hypothetical protein
VPAGPKAAEPDERRGKGGDVDRYESLRAQALGGQPEGWRLGLALFQGRGMAAWLRACRSIPPVGSRPSDRPAAGEGLDGDLVGVLAAMALAVVG